MKKISALAICAPLILIGAAYPDDKERGYAAALPDAVAGPVTYRPCRPGAGDDRCIQLYERGVRASYARWLRQHGVGDERTQVAAVGGPDEPAPRAHARSRHADMRGAAPAGPAPRARARHADHDAHDDHRCHRPDGHGGDAHGM